MCEHGSMSKEILLSVVYGLNHYSYFFSLFNIHFQIKSSARNSKAPKKKVLINQSESNRITANQINRTGKVH